MCFSKDGQCTLAASLDSTLRLLDKDTGELLGEYVTPSPSGREQLDAHLRAHFPSPGAELGLNTGAQPVLGPLLHKSLTLALSGATTL